MRHATERTAQFEEHIEDACEARGLHTPYEKLTWLTQGLITALDCPHQDGAEASIKQVQALTQQIDIIAVGLTATDFKEEYGANKGLTKGQ